MKFKTEQEEFWSGNFGNEYASRNSSDKLLASNVNLFSHILSHTKNVDSILEVGANIGMNLLAIKKLLPEAGYTAIEINKTACELLSQYSWINVINNSALQVSGISRHSFVLTKGVLIHINPEKLSLLYQTIYDSSSKYICLIEYYNPSPVEIPYRGHANKLFKRDFAGDMLDKFNDLKLVSYGFAYHRDNNFPQDDLNWFLMEKNNDPVR